MAELISKKKKKTQNHKIFLSTFPGTLPTENDRIIKEIKIHIVVNFPGHSSDKTVTELFREILEILFFLAHCLQEITGLTKNKHTKKHLF